jgi:S-adenosylmethionine decarboxylase
MRRLLGLVLLSLIQATALGVDPSSISESTTDSPSIGSPLSKESTGHAPATEPDFVFEGIEKRIEVIFDVKPGDNRGLRALPRGSWDRVCTSAVCTIIHEELSEDFDSYILSESSLFVFRDRVMIKTCGTTRPLESVHSIIEEARRIGLEPLDMTYSRGSFLFPDRQLHPHNSLEAELEYLTDLTIGSSNTPGKSCLIGDPDGAFWLVHRKQLRPGSEKPCSRVMVDCIMTGLPSEVCFRYFKNMEQTSEYNEVVMSDSLESIDPSFRIVGKCFEPCGYSCNAHSVRNDERYFTVHITPEEAFSYASVEIVFNQKTESTSLVNDIQVFIARVANVFKPRRMLVSILSANGPVTSNELLPSFESSLDVYNQVDAGTYSFSRDLCADDVVASSVIYQKQTDDIITA